MMDALVPPRSLVSFNAVEGAFINVRLLSDDCVGRCPLRHRPYRFDIGSFSVLFLSVLLEIQPKDELFYGLSNTTLIRLA